MAKINEIMRYCFIVFNVAYLIVGLILIGFSLWLQYAAPIHEVLILAKSSIVIIYCILALGCVLLLMGISGAIGAWFGKKWMLVTYLVVTLIFLFAQIGVLVFGFADKPNLKSNLQRVWTSLANETKYLIQDRTPCHDSIVSWVDSNVLLLAVIGGVVIFVEIFQISATSILIHGAVKSNRVESQALTDKNQMDCTQFDNEVFENQIIEQVDNTRKNKCIPFGR